MNGNPLAPGHAGALGEAVPVQTKDDVDVEDVEVEDVEVEDVEVEDVVVVTVIAV